MPELNRPRAFAFLPVTVHLETVGGIATPLILRGTPLPAERWETFSTASDNQKTVEVRVLMGESRLASKNVVLGALTVDGLPEQARGVPQIRVRFAVDRACVTRVSAEVTGAGVTVEQTFEAPADMSDEAIARMVTDAESAKGEEDSVVAKIQASNRAQNLIAQAESRLKRSSDSGISKAVAELGLALQQGNGDEIRSKGDALERVLSSPLDLDAFTDLFSTFQKPNRPPVKPATVAKSKTPSPSKLTSRATVSSVAASKGSVLGRIFGGGAFTLDPKLCFVLMPFSENYRAVYDDHVRPTIESAGLRCQRADEVAGVTSITWDIWERINAARFLVADLTERNANVFYEVGLAHAISKDVILITQSMEFVQFDLRAVRCIEYEYTPRGVRAFELQLRSTIDAVMRNG